MAEKQGYTLISNSVRGRRISLPLLTTGTMHPKRYPYYTRCIIVITLAIFLFIQFHPFNFSESRDLSLTEPTNDSVDAILSIVPSVLHKLLTPKTSNQTLAASFQHNGTLSNGADGSASLFDVNHPPNITEIKRQIAKYNEMQLVLNENKFGPLQNDSVIFLVQVHIRITNLRHLIASLALARDISKVLLIFSHDFYDKDINDLIQSIDFCKVMQIFYPYSIQTHPHEFPGKDPNDCPRFMTKDQAIIRKCNNALHPDLNGHYRDGTISQLKHHFWWKANRVFDQLEVTRNHTGLVLLLEDDHYVAEDILYMLEIMQRSTKDLCPQCNIFSLGGEFLPFEYETSKSKVEIMSWLVGWGLTFNRTTWEMIRHCRQDFCLYDDYNYDWSLQHVWQHCLPKKLYGLNLKAPRVFHLGVCGTHFKKENCDPSQVVSKIQEVLSTARKSGQIFPKSLTLTSAYPITKTMPSQGFASWGDPRDQELCMNMTLTTK